MATTNFRQARLFLDSLEHGNMPTVTMIEAFNAVTGTVTDPGAGGDSSVTGTEGFIPTSGTPITAPGNIGETKHAVLLKENELPVINNTTIVVKSLTLSAGVWAVYAGVFFHNNAATLQTSYAAISVASQTLPTDEHLHYIATDMDKYTGYTGETLVPRIVSTTAIVDVFLLARAIFGAGSQTVWGQITAIRIG